MKAAVCIGGPHDGMTVHAHRLSAERSFPTGFFSEFLREREMAVYELHRGRYLFARCETVKVKRGARKPGFWRSAGMSRGAE